MRDLEDACMPTLTRRVFLLRGGVTLGALAVAACAPSAGETSEPDEARGDATSSGGESAAPRCDDVSGLTPELAERRIDLGHTELSTEAGRSCGGCNFFTAASAEYCAGCSINGSPVSPAGWCRSFVPRM